MMNDTVSSIVIPVSVLLVVGSF